MIKTPEQTTHEGRKAQEDFFIKYFTSHFICKVSKSVTQSLRVRGSWRPNIMKYFDPEVMPVSVVSFSFSMAAQPAHWLSLLNLVPLLNSTRLSTLARLTHWPELNCPLFNSSAFKLPRGDMDTPPQLLPISSDRDVSLPLSLEWPVWSSSSGNNCHPVQRSLSSGASVYESIMGSFLPRPISSANFRPRDFLS